MNGSLYITACEAGSGKTVVALGAMQFLLSRARNPAFFRPIISEPEAADPRDPAVNLLLTHFRLNVPYESAYAFTLREAVNLLNSGRRAELLETVLNKYKALERDYDVILCEGTDVTGGDAAFEFELNAEIAANLGAPVLVVCNALHKSADEITASARIILDLLYEKNVDVAACIVNRAEVGEKEAANIAAAIRQHGNAAVRPAAYTFPEVRTLSSPTAGDIRKRLNAEVLYGHDGLDTLVDDYLVAAMHVENFLKYLKPGCLLVTPGDRVDIVLAGMASRLSSAYPDIAGILLTGNIGLPEPVRNLVESWIGSPVPVMSVPGNTSETVQALARCKSRIETRDTRKINAAVDLFNTRVDADELEARLAGLRCAGREKITPKMFEHTLLARAAARRMRIVLPEGAEERILRAAAVLSRGRVADIVLLGREKDIKDKTAALGINPEVTVIRPELSPKFEEYATIYYEMRKHKGLSMDQARAALSDPTYYGTMMVCRNDAQGMVSGSINTTAHTVRPAFEIIKTRPDASIVSSVFLMCLRDRVVVFGDCAVNPNPTAEQLADIAIQSARTAGIFGIEPRVAMLSYSTGSSGKGADVDLVVEAVKIAQRRAPELPLDGPLQYDAAVDPGVARTKLPDSKVAGRATVFIFPDLNTGNNTYKAVQRASGAVAIGPVLQGLNKPVNDLSRGCTVPDIVNTVAITAIQAQAASG
ncbi:MAG: phosphate acetyltransferase [Desulfovibrio sp.]|jgi:phosphate acetyltransferase|nr:phosphate acetyltransferase [Desulfovibrio sp.]